MNPTRSTAIDRSIVTRRVRPMTSSNDDAEWRRLGTTRTRRMSDPKPKPPFPIYLCPLPLLSTTRARPRTTINNFTPNHARAHGVQVNASMGGFRACVRDVVRRFSSVRSTAPHCATRISRSRHDDGFLVDDVHGTCPRDATRAWMGVFSFASMGSIARARRRRCRAHGWMDGWMDGWDGVWGLRV